MADPVYTLADLGWNEFFQNQLTADETEKTVAHRVIEVHRNGMETMSPVGAARIPMPEDLVEQGVAVGDWALVDKQTGYPVRILDRKSEIKRRAAGDLPTAQLIAANIDTLFIVSSCNADFNTARIERYLALARQAQVEPVLVLTKADIADDTEAFRAAAERDFKDLAIEIVNAKAKAVTEQLSPWCKQGNTVALIGSSGVGKTTLMNALTGQLVPTQEIREDDAKGRHTTTARSMYPMHNGGWLIDTPGMRALRLFDVAEGVDIVFSDVSELAEQCRFNDCAHDTEPGCAVQAAIANGELDPARLMRWQKLQKEDVLNTETMADRHARERRLEARYRAGRARGRKKRDT